MATIPFSKPRPRAATRRLTFFGITAFGAAAAGVGLVLWVRMMHPLEATALTEEDSLVENLTMSAFALAALTCLVAAFRSAGALRLYLSLWAVLAAVFCGEEVSWGQRWFGFETPELLADNYQGEANVHNLSFLTPRVVNGPADLVTSQGAFYVGFGLYFLALPLLFWLCRPAGRLADRLAFPHMPGWLLAAVWLPIVLSFALAALTPFGPTREALTEAREFCFAASILLYCAFLAADPWRPEAAKR